ncbi:hypothetical protein RBA41_08235 [Massilia sp. CCM 9210]|uniref:hypothetical protein n=1 Tax=Massilia scottii TaxID=3057166 RepID=UPI00279681E9|nr:hypothetical protein [Massilia sp. CCM 9210]MDQ1813290.1 hypothetical protein [Massilia sp. CCM 9210]
MTKQRRRFDISFKLDVVKMIKEQGLWLVVTVHACRTVIRINFNDRTGALSDPRAQRLGADRRHAARSLRY